LRWRAWRGVQVRRPSRRPPSWSARAASTRGAGTQGAPFRSLKQALLVAKPGDTVQLENGSYDAADGETWDYSAAAGITVAGEDAEQTLLQAPLPDAIRGRCAGRADSQVIALEAASKLTLQNLTLVGFYVGLQLAVPAQVSLRHVVIRDGITAVQVAANDCQVEAVDTTLSILEGEGAALKLPDTSLRGEVSLERATVTGGVFVAGADAKLSIVDSTLDGNKLERRRQFCRRHARHRRFTDPFGHGALRHQHARRSRVATNTRVEGGNYALYQLAGSSKLRSTRLLNYSSIGLYYASGSLDLGTETEAGNNTLTNRKGGSEALGIYVDTGTAPGDVEQHQLRRRDSARRHRASGRARNRGARRVLHHARPKHGVFRRAGAVTQPGLKGLIPKGASTARIRRSRRHR